MLAVCSVSFPSLARAQFLDACEDFNLLRFTPSKLEECIKDIKNKQTNLELDNDLLRLNVCSLALIVSNGRSAPDADLEVLIKDTCPARKSKNKAPSASSKILLQPSQAGVPLPKKRPP